MDYKVVFSTKNRKKTENTGKKRKNRIREVLFHVPKLYWDCYTVFGKDPVAYMVPSGQQIVLLYPLMLTWPGVSGGETKICFY